LPLGRQPYGPFHSSADQRPGTKLDIFTTKLAYWPRLYMVLQSVVYTRIEGKEKKSFFFYLLLVKFQRGEKKSGLEKYIYLPFSIYYITSSLYTVYSVHNLLFRFSFGIIIKAFLFFLRVRKLPETSQSFVLFFQIGNDWEDSSSQSKRIWRQTKKEKSVESIFFDIFRF
jgi:hypothetical protein